MAIKNIEIRVITKTAKNGNKFPTFKAKKLDGTRIPIKFTRDVKNLPENDGIYIFTIDTENMNKSHDDYGEVYWAKKVENWIDKPNVDEANEEF